MSVAMDRPETVQEADFDTPLPEPFKFRAGANQNDSQNDIEHQLANIKITQIVNHLIRSL